MKKLFSMLALAIFSFAFVSCNDTTKPNPDPAPFTLAADKTTVAPGDQIVFTITGDLTGHKISFCDNKGCSVITDKIVNGKYTLTVTSDTTVVSDFYAQKLPSQEMTNKVKITINAPKK